MTNRLKIAVVGSGIAGLTAAWLLSTRHEVTLFEKSPRLGMDAHSLDVQTPQGSIRVDVPLRVFFSGFYPNLTALYRHLGIQFEPINYAASFGLINGETYFRFDNYKVGRYAVPFLKGPRALTRKALRIGLDNLRFFRQIPRALSTGIDDSTTLSEFVAQQGYSVAFAEGYLYPAFAGICTCSHNSVKSYPARVILEYLNSGLLLSSVQRVTGGTQEVVDRLIEDVAEVKLGAEITQAQRVNAGVALRCDNENKTYDLVVMATQANQTTKIIRDSDPSAYRVLEDFRYETSRVVVHSDRRLAPSGGARNWAPVNFMLQDSTSTPMATIWLNAIQSIAGPQPVFQSWNPLIEPEPQSMLGEAGFERPVVTTESLRALKRIDALHQQPDRRTWFCGSYASHGIPLLESAATSAIAIAERFGCRRPWDSTPNEIRMA